MKLEKPLVVNVCITAGLAALGSVTMVLAGYPNLAYVLFAGLTVGTCIDHAPKDIPAMLGSEVSGLIWAMVMFGINSVVTPATGQLAIGFFCAIFFGTIAMILLHMRFLANTPFSVVPVMFLVIFCWFSSTDFAVLPIILVAIAAGMLFAVLADVLTNLICVKNEAEAV